MNMKLIGAPTIKDVVPGMVDISNLNAGAAPDTMFEANCKCPQTYCETQTWLTMQMSECYLWAYLQSCNPSPRGESCSVASLSMYQYRLSFIPIGAISRIMHHVIHADFFLSSTVSKGAHVLSCVSSTSCLQSRPRL
jgi:hypothetical protein